MDFSTLEDTVSEKKNKYGNFFSRFYNSRVFIIIASAIVITIISLSIWFKSSNYQILYNHLSDEDRIDIINQLNNMKVPYQFTETSGQLLVPENKIYELRLYLAENNLPRISNKGFEILEQEKFGVSQFNENINYQRALEGELSRTIQRINIIKSVRIHLALPKSSVFIEDKQEPSASLVLNVKIGSKLSSNQINAILHLVSSSISGLSIHRITIVDQFGHLLNNSDFDDDESNNLKFQYSEIIEQRYVKRIESILEPLFGKGNVHAQVTAQIDFSIKERTQDNYTPNTNNRNQSIRSYQTNIHDEINKNYFENSKKINSLPDNLRANKEQEDNKNYSKKHQSSLNKLEPLHNFSDIKKSNINHENTVNYELNHTIVHTKMNIGEIQRLSAAVVINFTKNNHGKIASLSNEDKKNVENLVRQVIGFSKKRGDSVSVVNSLFFKPDIKIVEKEKNIKNIKNIKNLDYFMFFTPCFFVFLFFLFILKKCFCSVVKTTNSSVNNNKKNVEKETTIKLKNQENLEDNLNENQLIHQICKISNQNPRTVALIIRKWMSNKI